MFSASSCSGIAVTSSKGAFSTVARRPRVSSAHSLSWSQQTIPAPTEGCAFGVAHKEECERHMMKDGGKELQLKKPRHQHWRDRLGEGDMYLQDRFLANGFYKGWGRPPPPPPRQRPKDSSGSRAMGSLWEAGARVDHQGGPGSQRRNTFGIPASPVHKGGWISFHWLAAGVIQRNPLTLPHQDLEFPSM